MTATIHCGDCIRGMAEKLEPDSVDLVVTSIPFGALFQYSAKNEDIGNNPDVSVNSDGVIDMRASRFGLHLRFFIEQLVRVMKPGTNACIHIQQLITYRVQHGYMGRRDFRGAVIDLFSAGGLEWKGEVVIPKNPQAIAQRQQLHSLLFITGMRNARDLAPAVNDYVLIFQKPGEAEPVKCLFDAVRNPDGWITRQDWIRDAHGVWTDIRETDVLDGWKGARDTDDEKHVCLARDSLVLTYDGYRPIQDVCVGDRVLTHEGRWRPVVAVSCNGVKPVRRIDAQGVPGLTVTDGHLLWARDVRGYSAQRAAASRTTPEWLRADEAHDAYLNLRLPPIEESPLTEDEWWIVGRWLADGHLEARYDGLMLSIGYQKLDATLSKLGDRAGAMTRRETAAQVRVLDRNGVLRSVIRRCGKGAAGKVVPGEALALNESKARALLDGYLAGDGHLIPGRERWMATTVSRPLALGMALVTQRAYGVVASVRPGRCGSEAIIQGRTVNCSPEWTMSFELPREGRHNCPFILDDGAWKKVRSNERAGEAEVWDIQVAEDESFVVEGATVHNCPLQLEVIRRCIRLYSNPGEMVLDPFMGIGSTAHVAVEQGRNVVGFELKESYHRQAVRNASRASDQAQVSAAPDLVNGREHTA